MAAPVVTVTIKKVFYSGDSRREKVTRIAIQLSGTTPSYTSGGETVDLSGALNPRGIPRGRIVASPLRSASDIASLNNIIGVSFTLTQNGSSPTIKNFLLQGWNGSTQIASNWPTGTFGATPAAAPEILFDIYSGAALG